MPILIKGSGGAQKTPTFNTNNLASSGKIVATAGNKSATLTLGPKYDNDFMSSNIVSGKTIFGVTGTAYKVASGVMSGSGSNVLTLPISGASVVYFVCVCCNQEIQEDEDGFYSNTVYSATYDKMSNASSGIISSNTKLYGNVLDNYDSFFTAGVETNAVTFANKFDETFSKNLDYAYVVVYM